MNMIFVFNSGETSPFLATWCESVDELDKGLQINNNILIKEWDYYNIVEIVDDYHIYTIVKLMQQLHDFASFE